MVDYKTAQNSGLKLGNSGDPGDPPREYLDKATMDQDSPPEPMVLLLPHLIHGYNMLAKKWGAYSPAVSNLAIGC